MHPCLRVTEILAIVMELISEEQVSPTLCALARTCKAFHDPALNVLWRTQESFVPLVKCMPSDLWVETEDQLLNFRRPIFPSDWLRFHHYSSRIRCLTLSDDVTVDILRSLSVSRPMGALLPKLSTFYWDADNNDLYPFMHLFLTPSIKNLYLELYCQTLPSIFSQLLDCLAFATPFIEHLKLESPDHDGYEFQLEPPMPVLSMSPLRLQCLTTFDWIMPIDIQDITSLAELPNLRTFRIGIGNSMMGVLPARLAEFPFPALRSLSVLAENLELFAAFFESLQSYKLEQVKICCHEPTNPGMVRQVLWNLHRKCSHDSLKHLHLQDHMMGTTSATPAMVYVLNVDAVKSLLSFKNLKELVLNLRDGVNVDNAAVAEMAAAWPCLERLELPSSGSLMFDSRATINGLIPLVQRCPKLNVLRLGVDARPCAYDPANMGLSRNELVRWLEFGVSPISTEVPVARALSHLFPNLQQIDAREPDAGRNTWSKVQHVARILRDTRLDEREWVKREGA